jgi:hypothetical protein
MDVQDEQDKNLCSSHFHLFVQRRRRVLSPLELYMKLILYILAGALGFLGFIFIAGSQGMIMRIVIGLILFVAAGALVYMARVQPEPSQTTIVQQIDLSGDVKLQEIRCRSCNAPLSDKSIRVEAGAIFVNCEFCGATYQFEEAPKW